MEEFKKALISNKDDTSNLIYVVGDLQVQVDDLIKQISILEQKLKKNHLLHELEMPILTLSGVSIGVGLIQLFNGQDTGKYFVIAGSVVFLTFELQYNLGKFVFKWY